MSNPNSRFSRHGQQQLSRGNTQVQVKEDRERHQESVNVTRVPLPKERNVDDFHAPEIRRQGQGDYGFVRSHYGSFAITDPGREARGVKDSRFLLNPLQRDPLAVVQEENRIIEERVKERIVAVADQVREEAHSEGYQDGLKKGYQEAFKKFQAEGASQLERFKAFLADCEAAKEEIFRANEQAILEILLRMEKQILLRELGSDPDYLLRLSREMLSRIGVRENIKIKVRPADLEVGLKLKEGLEAELGELRNLKIEAAPVIQQGGVIIETDWNAIDAAVETQLKGIFEALLSEGQSAETDSHSDGSESGQEG
jgi:flagellar assembly protein FliH